MLQGEKELELFRAEGVSGESYRKERTEKTKVILVQLGVNADHLCSGVCMDSQTCIKKILLVSENALSWWGRDLGDPTFHSYSCK